MLGCNFLFLCSYSFISSDCGSLPVCFILLFIASFPSYCSELLHELSVVRCQDTVCLRFDLNGTTKSEIHKTHKTHKIFERKHKETHKI